MKKLLVIGISIILSFGMLLKGIEIVRGRETVYDKIDKIVETNKLKAERLYDVLGELQGYIGENLGKKQKGIIDFSNIHGFDLSKLDLSYFNEIIVFDDRMISSSVEGYYNNNPYIFNYKANTFTFRLNRKNRNYAINIYNLNKYNLDEYYRAYISKYNKIINGKIKLNSKEFEQIETYEKTRNNILNIRHGFAQMSSIKPHFIKDSEGKTKGIAFYVFEGNGNMDSMDLHYKIYSIRNYAMMEVDINMIEPENTEKGKWSDELIIDKSIDTQNFEQRYFKNGYFNGVGDEDEWQKRKEKIKYFEDVVRKS